MIIEFQRKSLLVYYFLCDFSGLLSKVIFIDNVFSNDFTLLLILLKCDYVIVIILI